MAEGSTGSYAITTIRSMPWLGSTASGKSKTPKKKSKINIPILSAAAECVHDPLWKSVLLEGSIGKFPKGILCRGDVILYRKRGKTTESPRIPNNPLEASSIVIEFIKTHTGIRSSEDIINDKQAKLLSKLKQPIINSWSDIKSDIIKRSLIERFIESISDKLNLDKTHRNSLRGVITLGFLLGKIDKTSVKMEYGRILNIDGIIFNQETLRFDIDKNLPVKIKKVKMKDVPSVNGFYLNPNVIYLDAYVKTINTTDEWTKEMKGMMGKNKKSKESDINIIINNTDKGEITGGDRTVETSLSTGITMSLLS